MMSRRISSLLALFILVCGAAFANEQEAPRRPDVPYVHIPEVVVDKMLELVKPGKNDVVYDLGSGVKEAKENAQQISARRLW